MPPEHVSSQTGGAVTLAGHLRTLGLDTTVFDCTFSAFRHLREEFGASPPREREE
jgi:hypothetical protein